ncbi:MAG: hypothetical protein Tsb0020_46920 [Haliangiales bacterium]
MLARSVFAAVLAVAPAAAQDALQDPYEEHLTVWDGFLAAATDAIPSCSMTPEIGVDDTGEPVLPTGDGAADCAVLVTYRGETWATASAAELVIAAEPDTPDVRLRVEGADWAALRQGLEGCLAAWLDTGEAACAPVDWKARALAAEADLDRLLHALRVLGMAVEAGR